MKEKKGITIFMLQGMKKLFGGIDLTWPKVIIAAIIAGAITAVFAIVPAFHYTSFITITATLEVWIFFGIVIIMNSKSNLDSALKCFVFFLISQPLVYLIQVPFSYMGWQLFQFYKYWFYWTVLCLPMGYVGYYMKKNKWWGYLILLPMIGITALSYFQYFSMMQFYFPKYILIVLFCAFGMIFYPVLIFDDKRIQLTGAAIGSVLVIALSAICFMRPPVYSAEILGTTENRKITENCKVSFADPKYGDVSIVYEPNIDEYMVRADFKKAGDTVLTLEMEDGTVRVYDVHIERDTYSVTKRD